MTDALASLPDAEAMVAQLDAEIAEIETQLRTRRADRSRWRDLAAAVRRFNDEASSTSYGRQSAVYGTVRDQVLAILEDGRPHRASEFERMGAKSSVNKHLRELIRDGVASRVGRGSYQLLKPPPPAGSARAA